MSRDRFSLLIDGYNLMHSAGYVPRRSGPGVFEKQRERFLRWLLRYLSPELQPLTIVVFDGRETDNREVSFSSFQELQLRFSPAGVEADDLIESLIELHSAPKQLTVVSSDHRLHRAARRRKARCVDSEVFVDQLEQSAQSSKSIKRRKPAELNAAEVEEWLDLFGDVEELLDPDAVSPASTSIPDRSPETTREQTTPLPPDASPQDGTAPPHVIEDAEQVAEATRLRNQDAQDSKRSDASDSVEFWESRLRELLDEE